MEGIVLKLAKVGIIRKFFLMFPLVSLDGKMPLVVLILNCVLPGVGAIVAGIMKWKKDKGKKLVIFGVCEMLLCCVFFIGWICSIIHGVLLYLRSKGAKFAVQLAKSAI